MKKKKAIEKILTDLETDKPYQGPELDLNDAEEIWQKVKLHIDSQQKPLKKEIKIYKPIYAIAALALLGVTIGLGYYINKNKNSASLQIVKTSGPKKGALFSINHLNENSIDKSKTLQSFKIANVIQLDVRNVVNLQSRYDQGKLTLSFNLGQAAIHFTKNPDITELEIIANHITYKVVGTQFLIDAKKANNRLFVKKGHVKVYLAEKALSVKANQIFNSERSDQKIINTDVTDTFKNFFSRKAAEKKRKPLSKKRKLRKLTLHLKKGNTISGFVIKETGTYYDIKTKLTGTIRVPKADISKKK